MKYRLTLEWEIDVEGLAEAYVLVSDCVEKTKSIGQLTKVDVSDRPKRPEYTHRSDGFIRTNPADRVRITYNGVNGPPADNI